MIGTLWKAKTDYICFNKGDILIATRYFHNESVDKMYVSLTSPQGAISTWREEWIGDKFERLS
jgi:hypothetical protein